MNKANCTKPFPSWMIPGSIVSCLPWLGTAATHRIFSIDYAVKETTALMVLLDIFSRRNDINIARANKTKYSYVFAMKRTLVSLIKYES
jgi:hypothetical protein